jgi:agmatinase
MSANPDAPPPGDAAFLRSDLKGTVVEATYAGALSFMRRKYTRDLSGVDIAVTGIPFDQAVTNRPGTRFGPQAVRAASAHFAWGPYWPWNFDPFDTLAVVDYGDCFFDWGRKEDVPDAIRRHVAGILAAGASSLVIGGDHFTTYPVLKAHAERHGPLALVQFDAHRDVEPDQNPDSGASTTAPCSGWPSPRESSTRPIRCRSASAPPTRAKPAMA